MIISSEKIEVPDECPEDCPGCQDHIGQGGLCYRCPITNCAPLDYEGEVIYLVEPEEYRPDWARAWKEWFDGGMKGLPKLYLIIVR